MIARVITQLSKFGEKHVVITRDMETPVDDFILTSPGWENSKVTDNRVLMLSLDQEAVQELLDVELYTQNVEPASINVSMDKVAKLLGISQCL